MNDVPSSTSPRAGDLAELRAAARESGRPDPTDWQRCSEITTALEWLYAQQAAVHGVDEQDAPTIDFLVVEAMEYAYREGFIDGYIVGSGGDLMSNDEREAVPGSELDRNLPGCFAEHLDDVLMGLIGAKREGRLETGGQA